MFIKIGLLRNKSVLRIPLTGFPKSQAFLITKYGNQFTKAISVKNISQISFRNNENKPKEQYGLKSNSFLKTQIKNPKIKVNDILKTTRELKNKIIPKHENIYTLPNFLTATRLVAAPFVGYFILKHQINYALPLFIYSCVTDFLDGYLARKYNLKSIVGSIIDPMADKLLMIITSGALAYSNYDFPMYLAVLILGKDIFMGLSAIYIRYKTLPAPKTFIRYWDFSIPSVKVFPTTISKWNTGFQMLYITLAIFKPVVDGSGIFDANTLTLCSQMFEYYGYFVGTTTVLGGASYLWKKDAIKILK